MERLPAFCECLQALFLRPHDLWALSTAILVSFVKFVNKGRRDMRWGMDKIHYMAHRELDTLLPICNGLCFIAIKKTNYVICRKVDVTGDNHIVS